jgi:hypothetical protein
VHQQGSAPRRKRGTRKHTKEKIKHWRIYLMRHRQQAARGLVILALALMIAGCTTPTAVVVPPTQDIPAVRTESAQTVVAKLTIEAALNPTATAAVEEPQPVVVTATPAPATATAAEPVVAATATLALPQATATLAPTAAATLSGGGVMYATATRRAGPDQAQLLEQRPTDGTKFNAGEVFDVAWTFKNIGTSTWNINYDYRFDRGAGMSASDLYALPREVKPGETITLYADYVAPATAGRYVDYWELTNQNGEVFYNFYVIIDVR